MIPATPYGFIDILIIWGGLHSVNVLSIKEVVFFYDL